MALQRWYPDAPTHLERDSAPATAAALIAHLERGGDPRAAAIQARIEGELLESHGTAMQDAGDLEGAARALLDGAHIEGYGSVAGAAAKLARMLRDDALDDARLQTFGAGLYRALPETLREHTPHTALWLTALQLLVPEASSARRRIARRALEARVRDACRAARWDEALTLMLRGFEAQGTSVEGLERPLHIYLSGRCRSGTELEEAYAIFCLRLTESLPDFAWRCSLQRYSYRLAASAAAALRDDAFHKRAIAFETPHHAELAALTRTRTRLYLRSSLQRLARQLFQEHLEAEDWSLVFHRVYQRASWREIAALTLLEDDPSEAVLKQTSARLRQRFSRSITPRLRDIVGQLRVAAPLG